MEKARLIILPALFVLAVLSACAEYPDPSAACNDLPIGRAPRYDPAAGSQAIRLYLRDDPARPFTATDQHPVSNTRLGPFESTDDSQISLVACITVTPTDFVMTCDYGFEMQKPIGSGIAPDPTLAVLDAALQPVSASLHSAHYDLSLHAVRTGDVVMSQEYDIAVADRRCPDFITVVDDRTSLVQTPDPARDQAFLESILPYISP